MNNLGNYQKYKRFEIGGMGISKIVYFCFVIPRFISVLLSPQRIKHFPACGDNSALSHPRELGRARDRVLRNWNKASCLNHPGKGNMRIKLLRDKYKHTLELKKGEESLRSY